MGGAGGASGRHACTNRGTRTYPGLLLNAIGADHPDGEEDGQVIHPAEESSVDVGAMAYREMQHALKLRGPSSPKPASRSLRRALLTPQVNPGSLYRCG